jgi:serine/threonine-protein kinase
VEQAIDFCRDVEPLKLAQQVLSATAAPASSVRPALPPGGDAVLARALSRSPGDRWPSIAAFVEALTVALDVPAPVESGGTLDGDALLSRYDIGDVLGPGRLGSVVRRGVHRALALPVAIRHLKREGQSQWEALRARFLQEARTLQVRHPHLLHVRDYGEDASGVFVVTDIVEGPSLRVVLAGGAVDWPRARRMILQMTDAAGALHGHGGLLTGVNPDTIRVTGAPGAEHVVLTTGGVRALADVLATMPESQLRGQASTDLELPYLAPEVLMGRPPDVRTDLFTLGVVAYQLVTARVPFTAPTLPELLGTMLTTPPAAIDATPGPDGAREAIVRCLAPAPAARGTLDDLQRAVRAAG